MAVMKDKDFEEQFGNIEEKLDFHWDEVEKRKVILKMLVDLINKYLEGGDKNVE
jgi:hypothetical protein